jgi:REP element-mobilizing transposase RayT
MLERKQIRLKDYDYSMNGAYFITICTKDKKKILGTILSVGDDDHIVPKVVLSKYGLIVEKYIKGINGIDKYVVMPNHIHMIIKINNGTMWSSSPTISQLVKAFKTLVSKEIGHSIFQRSFYDHIIRNEHDYQEIWKYIDENPLKWTLDKYYYK